MNLFKATSFICVMMMLSSCATLFYERRPTLQEAPIACGLDILFGFTIVPLAVDALYGSCRMEGLKK